jgi:cytochrome P450 family 135
VPTASLPPGPRLPVAVQTLLYNHRHRTNPWLRRRYGDVIYLRTFPRRPIVQLADIDHVKMVFSGSPAVFHGGEGNAIVEPIIGSRSVMLKDEEDHTRARKLLMPAFHGKALAGYRELIAEVARARIAAWPVGTAFSAHDEMQELTLEVILRVVFGVSDGPRLAALRTAIGRFVDFHPIDFLGWYVPPLQRFGRWRRKHQEQQRIDELLYSQIAEHRAAAGTDERTDVLARLIAVRSDEGDRLSDAELHDQLLSLLLAGHETTATSLAWALYELARDGKLLARATESVDAGDETYLDAVVKESMRLHPVLSEVPRKLTTDIELGGYRIPAGFTVLPAIGLIHSDPRHYPEPEAFRPERFLDSGPPPGTWLPFGGGTRRCLGAGFSLLESTIVLREVLSRYELVPGDDRPEQTRARHVMLVPARGARIVVRPR